MHNKLDHSTFLKTVMVVLEEEYIQSAIAIVIRYSSYSKIYWINGFYTERSQPTSGKIRVQPARTATSAAFLSHSCIGLYVYSLQHSPFLPSIKDSPFTLMLRTVLSMGFRSCGHYRHNSPSLFHILGNWRVMKNAPYTDINSRFKRYSKHSAYEFSNFSVVRIPYFSCKLLISGAFVKSWSDAYATVWLRLQDIYR